MDEHTKRMEKLIKEHAETMYQRGIAHEKANILRILVINGEDSLKPIKEYLGVNYEEGDTSVTGRGKEDQRDHGRAQEGAERA